MLKRPKRSKNEAVEKEEEEKEEEYFSKKGTNPRLRLPSYSCLKLGQTWNCIYIFMRMKT
jgi:hypothetical protein